MRPAIRRHETRDIVSGWDETSHLTESDINPMVQQKSIDSLETLSYSVGSQRQS
jgi:hypothetical protein